MTSTAIIKNSSSNISLNFWETTNNWHKHVLVNAELETDCHLDLKATGLYLVTEGHHESVCSMAQSGQRTSRLQSTGQY